MIKSITIHLQEQKYQEKNKSKRGKFFKKDEENDQFDYKKVLGNNLSYWASLKTKVKKKKAKVQEEEEVVAETQFELNVMFKQEEVKVNAVSAEEKLNNLATNIEDLKTKNKDETDKIIREIEDKTSENDVLGGEIYELEEENAEMEENIEVLIATNKVKQKKTEEIH